MTRPPKQVLNDPVLDVELWSKETMAKNIPSVVVSLSMGAKMEPMEWKEYDDRVVIVFTCGKKMVFYRDEILAKYIPSPVFETKKFEPKPTPVKKPATPPATKPHAGKKK